MPEMKTLNGYEIVDAKVRGEVLELQLKQDSMDEAIADIPTKVSQLENDSVYQTEEQVLTLINGALGVIENGSY
jgi:hypothetical protein